MTDSIEYLDDKSNISLLPLDHEVVVKRLEGVGDENGDHWEDKAVYFIVDQYGRTLLQYQLRADTIQSLLISKIHQFTQDLAAGIVKADTEITIDITSQDVLILVGSEKINSHRVDGSIIPDDREFVKRTIVQNSMASMRHELSSLNDDLQVREVLVLDKLKYDESKLDRKMLYGLCVIHVSTTSDMPTDIPMQTNAKVTCSFTGSVLTSITFRPADFLTSRERVDFQACFDAIKQPAAIWTHDPYALMMGSSRDKAEHYKRMVQEGLCTLEPFEMLEEVLMEL